MSAESSTAARPTWTRAARAGAVAGLLVAGTLLVSWFVPLHGWPAFAARRMKTNAALGTTLLGTALLCASFPGAGARRLSRMLAWTAAAIGALTVLEYAAGLDFGIDELLASDIESSNGTFFANRMSPVASMGLALLGSGLALLPSRRTRVALAGQGALVAVLAAVYVSLLGHAYDANQLLQPVTVVRRISLTSIFALGSVALGALCLRPALGVVATVAGRRAGAWMSRRLLPFALVGPAAFGYATVIGERVGLYSVTSGTALLVLWLAMTLGSLVLVLARALDVADARRREADRRLHQSLALTEALARAATVDEVAKATTSLGMEALGAQAGGLLVVSGDGRALEMRGVTGYSEEIDARYRQIPLAQRVPATDAVLARTAIFISSLDEYRRLYPHVPVEEMRAHRAWAALPLLGKDRVLGVVGLSFVEARTFDGPARVRLSQLAWQCGQALERALLFDSEHQALSRAEAAVRVRDDFLSAASHELRTPLTALQLQHELLARGLMRTNASPELSARAEKGRRQVEKLSVLVDRLLDVSRITAGRVVLERSQIELGALVREVAAGFGEAAAALVSVVAPEPVVGAWDRLRIEQVVTNLLSNALKYGANRPIEISVALEGSLACLKVKDHGLGIPAEALPRLFKRFERAAGTDYAGIGLGLWLSREFVTAHGGTIEVTSALGEGSEFVVRLPAVPQVPAAGAA